MTPALERDLESGEVERTRQALRQVAACPRDEQEALIGALFVATARCGDDLGVARELLGLWRTLRPTTGVEAALERLAGDVPAAEALLDEVGLGGAELGARLRGSALRAGRDHVDAMREAAASAWFTGLDPDAFDGADDPPPLPPIGRSPREVALRAWADRVEGLEPAGGDAADLRLLAARLGSGDRGWFCLFVARLAGAASVPALDVGALGDDVAQLAEEELVWPSFRLLARQLSRLGASGRALEPIATALAAITQRCGDEEGLAAVQRLLPDDAG